ncbi:MAG: energy-coupling factor ABC transporter substrate-binding protein [Archaeoglobales archaeon]|nr:energy-coupling factor ABC transporter substrate-binding protein [Archaeoglobales archaeon]
MGSKGLIFLILLLIASSEAQEWAGTDEKAEDLIKEINPDYEPWLSPIWEPPSGEIESLLFSVQAALGALLIGYILGYYRAKHARNA